MDHDEAVRRDRERETSIAKEALKLEPKDLVREIFVNSNSRSLNEAGLVSRPLAYFSALIVQLSEKADAAARANVRLQKTMVILTWAIAIFTVVMVIGLGYQIFSMSR